MKCSAKFSFFSSIHLPAIFYTKRGFSYEHFHDGGRYHIETSPLICRANQWTGFYMNGLVMKELTKNLNTAHAPTEFFYQNFCLVIKHQSRRVFQSCKIFFFK